MSTIIINKSLKLARELFPSAYNTRRNSKWHFAFAFRRNKLLAVGQNNMVVFDNKTRFFARRFGTGAKTRHAEIDVLSRLWGKIYIDGSIKLIVIRLNRFGKLCNSKPCKHCQTVLTALGVNRIFYSTSNGKVIQ